MAPSGFRPCCYTETATDLGFTTLAVNDHLVFLVPWLRWANGAGCRPGPNRRHDAGHYRLAASGPRPRPADQVADYAPPSQRRPVACRPRPRRHHVSFRRVWAPSGANSIGKVAKCDVPERTASRVA